MRAGEDAGGSRWKRNIAIALIVLLVLLALWFVAGIPASTDSSSEATVGGSSTMAVVGTR